MKMQMQMNRRSFLFSFILSCLGVLFAKIALGENRITDCKDCRGDYACCKGIENPDGLFHIPVFGWERDILIEQGGLGGVKVGHFEDFGAGIFIWHSESRDCPFLKDNRCLIYDKRPKPCRVYYCDDWKLTEAERLKIEQKVDGEWNENTCK